MPLQRRLPKRGFARRDHREGGRGALSATCAKVGAEAIDLAGLKKAGLVPGARQRAKIILAGKVDKKFAVSGHRRHQGRAGRHRGGRRQRGRWCGSGREQPGPTRRRSRGQVATEKRIVG